MSRRSRKRRVLPRGEAAWRPGFGPGESHWPGDDGPPPDPPSGDPPGGVREPRRPKPAPPSLAAEAPLPGPPHFARDRTGPPPTEVTGCPAGV
ncbi:MAG TPA: hypothetical protein VFV66_04025 [Nonomuraea sp.]|nr:hypothetical protein [Nonomuraea sp.]